MDLKFNNFKCLINLKIAKENTYTSPHLRIAKQKPCTPS